MKPPEAAVGASAFEAGTKWVARKSFPIWVLAISLGSAAPLNIKYRLHSIGQWHDLGHFLVFLITGVAACVLAPDAKRRIRLFVGICVWGFAIEWMEAGVWHNRLEWQDVWTDSLGAAIGFAMALTVPFLWRALRTAERPVSVDGNEADGATAARCEVEV